MLKLADDVGSDFLTAPLEFTLPLPRLKEEFLLNKTSSFPFTRRTGSALIDGM